MSDLEKIKDALKDRNLRAVARASGVHYNTVLAIAKGEERDYLTSTLAKLSAYLFGGAE